MRLQFTKNYDETHKTEGVSQLQNWISVDVEKRERILTPFNCSLLKIFEKNSVNLQVFFTTKKGHF